MTAADLRGWVIDSARGLQVLLPRLTLALSMVMSMAMCTTAWAQSTCYGTVADGRLEGGVKLPASGPNFQAYSQIGVVAGRTHVHAKVAAIVREAYRRLESRAPKKVFVYGETGLAEGGRIRPHKTHRNGTSVDFMVPVLDAAGHSVPLPASVFNKLGYDLEFDAQGRAEGLRIDFEAVAEHLYQLNEVAREQGAGLALVIFDLPYLPRLWATPRGPYLREQVNFLQGKPWIRHDEHYHVDFAVPCKPLKG